MKREHERALAMVHSKIGRLVPKMKSSFGILSSAVWGGKYLETMVNEVSANAVRLGPVYMHDYYYHAPTFVTPTKAAAVQTLPGRSHHGPGMTLIPRTIRKVR